MDTVSFLFWTNSACTWDVFALLTCAHSIATSSHKRPKGVKVLLLHSI